MTFSTRFWGGLLAAICAAILGYLAIYGIDGTPPALDGTPPVVVTDGGAAPADGGSLPTPDGGAAAGDGGPPAAATSVPFTLAAPRPYWYEGGTGAGHHGDAAALWGVDGTWVWCEDAAYCSTDVLPAVLADTSIETIWIDFMGHHENCSGCAPGEVAGVDACGYDEATCETWLSYAWDTDGTGPDQGWPAKTAAGGYYNFGSGKGWLDIDPATGVAYARQLDACFDSGRCKVMLCDDTWGFSQGDDFGAIAAEALSRFIKTSLWPNAYTMIRVRGSQMRDVPASGILPVADFPDGQFHYLDGLTAMLYLDSLTGSTPDIVSWMAAEHVYTDRWGIDLHYNLSATTGNGGGPSFEDGYTAMTAAQIIEYGTALCADTPAGVSLYKADDPGTAAYAYMTQPDIAAAIAQVAAVCRGG